MSMSNQEYVDRLFAGLGAAQQDEETGSDIARLFEGEASFEAAEALFGIDQKALMEKGRKLWSGVSKDLHTVFCDPKSQYHSKVAELIKTGSTGISTALAGVIVASLGTAIPILASATVAAFLARLVIEFFVSQGYTMGCAAWETALKPKEEHPAGGAATPTAPGS